MLRFIRDGRGNVSIIFGLFAVVIIGAGGLAVDFALWSAQRTALQEAADSGALAGAVELGLGGANAANRAEVKAKRFAESNRTSSVSAAIASASVDTGKQTVEVAFTAPARRYFSAVLISGDPNISVRSVAKVVAKVTACIYAMNASAARALNGNGSASLEGVDCAIQVNSADVNAIANSGTITASHICVVGGVSGSGYTPEPQQGCPPLNDPLADRVVPTPGACTHTNYASAVDVALAPGVYCGGIHLSSDADAALSPGVYFIVDGPLKVSGSASLAGNEVTFVLSGTASVDIAGTGAVQTTPPSSGELADISIMQDRNAPLGGVSKITGEGQFQFPGIVYLPRQALEIAGRASGNTFTPEYAAVIADTIKVSGQGELRATADTSAFSKRTAAQLTTVNVHLVK